MNRLNDIAVGLLARLHHWHQRRVLGTLARLGVTLNLPINGVRILLEPRHDYVQSQMLSTRSWERPVEGLIGEFAKDSCLMFDVGANIGYFSLLAARRMPARSKVVAFEPFPCNHEALLKNVELNGLADTVVCEKLALSGAPGAVLLYHSDGDLNFGTPSLLDWTGGGGPSVPALSVTLDSYRERHFPGRDVDLVKIDVEGGEWDVLLGMEDGLRDGRYRKIILEVHPSQLGLVGRSGGDVIGRLRRFGYSVLEIARDGLKAEYELGDDVRKFLAVAP